jgi:integral membrane sensor domain MASE1
MPVLNTLLVAAGLLGMAFGCYFFWCGMRTETNSDSIIEAAPELWMGSALAILSIMPLMMGVGGFMGAFG